MQKWNYNICKKILDAIPDKGDPIRYNELYNKLKPDLKKIDQIEDKKLHRKLGMMSRSTLTKYLNHLIFKNLVIRTEIKGSRGGGVEYRRNLAHNKINEMAKDATNTAYFQYNQLNSRITKIIKLLIVELKTYSETDQKNQSMKDYREMIDYRLTPMLHDLTKHVEEKQLDEDVFRCLLGDHDNMLRFRNYEYGYHIAMVQDLKSDTNAGDRESLPYHNLLLKTKYKDVEDELLSSINKEKVNEK